VHSGKPANMVIKPGDSPGIFFKRVDLKDGLIPAKYLYVSDTKLRNTTLGICPNCVQTIEHVMAALFIKGIRAAIIEIDGPEIPILDGSAKQFIEIFEKAEVTEFNVRDERIIIKKEIIVRQSDMVKELSLLPRLKLWMYNLLTGRKSDGYLRLYPYENGLLINATLVYKEPVIGVQSYEFLFDYTDAARKKFTKEMASARTFGKFSEWEYLKARGMARGANENNVIALNDRGDGTLNKLYFSDEFVRHKITDILGDMSLGGWIIGGVESYKGSHALNNLALRKLFSNSENYETNE